MPEAAADTRPRARDPVVGVGEAFEGLVVLHGEGRIDGRVGGEIVGATFTNRGKSTADSNTRGSRRYGSGTLSGHSSRVMAAEVVVAEVMTGSPVVKPASLPAGR